MKPTLRLTATLFLLSFTLGSDCKKSYEYPRDDDYDGYDGTEDCDDRNPYVHPGADEVCDFKDNDCDGLADEDVVDFPVWLVDGDGDGYGADSGVLSCERPPDAVDIGGDCDDLNPDAFPGAPEVCEDGADLNCDGAMPQDDNDQDGFIACEECDDFDENRNPDAPERCDGEDDDCDGTIDEDAIDAVPWYPDGDGDGYGVPGEKSERACSPPDGYGEGDDDCDDGNKTVYPGAEEVCDGLDNDCDLVLPTDELDQDEDGYDVCSDQDCDDTDDDVGPDGDNDLDGTVDCYDSDDDDDELSDTDEVAGTSGWVTDPLDPDTDGDGTVDGLDAAPLHSACDSAVYHYEDFSSDPLDGGWEVASGEWVWDGSGTWASAASFEWGVTWLPDEAYDDLVIDVVLQLDSDVNDAGVVFRVGDPGYGEYTGSYYFVGLNSGTDAVSLQYFSGGHTAILDEAEVKLDDAEPHRLTIKAIDTYLEVALDEVYLFSLDDKTLTSGSVGFRTSYSAATYDTILICE